MSRAAPVLRLEALFAAFTLALGLQTMRAFLPLVVYVYGARPGVTSVGMGQFAIGVFLLAWLAAVPLRLLGPRRALMFCAGSLALLRLAVQFVGPAQGLWLAAAGLVAFLWTVPALLAVARGRDPEGSLRVGVGLVMGLALDVVVAGAFWTWDPLWQRTAPATAVTLAVVGLYAILLRGMARESVDTGRTDAPLAVAWMLAGLGPLLLLHALLFHNPARLTAVTGWSLPAALSFILATDAVAVTAAAALRHQTVTLAAVLLLLPAAVLAHGVDLSAALGLIAGTVAAGLAMVAVLAAQGRGQLCRGLASTAMGWGLGVLLFAVAAFLYYVGYDIRLPFDNTAVPVGAAAIAALAAIGPARAMPFTPPLRPGRSRPIVVLLLVPVLLWLFARAPQAQPASGWPIRVMSYNLHQGYATSGAQDLEALARTIEMAGAEVVALQEVSRGWVINGSTEMLTWLARRLRLSYVWGPAADPIWGNAILARRPITASANAELPRGGAPMRRGVLWASVNLGDGQHLLVIATHFHHVEGQGQIRESQAAAVVRLWNRRERTVLMGDLNATPDAREMTLLKDAGLRDAFALAGQGNGLTYSSERPERRIDYIWVSPDLKARDFRVLPGKASDHLGIAVTVGR
jgi:endonuclease/exonuclease/phosphatase family metal-dependent hydrolase